MAPVRSAAADAATGSPRTLHDALSFSAANGLFPVETGRMPLDPLGRLGRAGEVGPAAPFPANAPNGAGPDASAGAERQDGGGGSLRLREFLRLISNVRGTGAESARPPALARPAMNGMPNWPTVAAPAGGSLLDAVLDVTIDSEVRELLTKIITPALEPGGFISFSIAGLGRFVLLFSEDDRSLRMVDLEGPFSLMIAQHRPSLGGGIGATGFDPATRFNAIEPSARGNATMTLQELLEFVRAQVMAFLINPLTIGGAVFSALLWLIWRLRRRFI